MLHYNTIEPQTLELLKKLQQAQEFTNLNLVGGTSLALQIGHRSSIDIDLFGQINLAGKDLLERLSSFGKVKPISISNAICTCTIDKIKVDIVNYQYPWIGGTIKVDALKLAHKKDIAAMKLSAITGRGSMKDFIDLFFLLRDYSLETMLDFYNEKYSDGSKILVLKSLSYFLDADYDVMPKMFETVNWPIIKEKITHSLKEYFLNFED